jgi:hypothetical protein
VLWLSFIVVSGLGLLASKAGFAAFEVVVLALVAFPSSIWENEVSFFAGVSVILVSFLLVLIVGCFIDDVEVILMKFLCY